ncbi:hypothetical protein [Pleomorphomonas sp. PLEO]|uniref:hypothetical protein n=1 Tax=Pleomorphomonas sp. PLEO TaxID=3239306 RepID=UPI00351E7473
MTRSFLSASLGAALALSSATGAFATVNESAANALISSLSSMPASSARDGLIAEIQSLSGACGGSNSGVCIVALQKVVAAAKAVSLTSTMKADVASLTRDTAANTNGVLTNDQYAALSSDVDSLSPTSPTGSTGATGGPGAGGAGGGATGGGPGGGNGGGSFGPQQADGAASPGVTG